MGNSTIASRRYKNQYGYTSNQCGRVNNVINIFLD